MTFCVGGKESCHASLAVVYEVRSIVK